MKTKKGFTIPELLAVIVILGVLITIAIGSYNGISNRMKQKTLENKLNYYKKTLGTDIVGNPIDGESYYIKDSNNNLISTTYRTINYYEKVYSSSDSRTYYRRTSTAESDFYGIIKVINNKSYLYPLAIYVNSAP